MKTLSGIILLLCLIVAARADCQEEETEFSLFGSIVYAWRMIASLPSAVFEEYETPPYEVLHTRTTYEVRKYTAQPWVCTSKEVAGYNIEVGQIHDDDVSDGMFMKLFRYITGNNDKATEIAMTIPVSVHYTTTQSGDTNKADMCFFIPEEHQAAPAKPNCSDVFLQDPEELQVIAIRRGGYPDKEEWEQMWKELKQDSEQNGDTGYDSKNYYTATYQSPAKFWSRRNEMWFPKVM